MRAKVCLNQNQSLTANVSNYIKNGSNVWRHFNVMPSCIWCRGRCNYSDVRLVGSSASNEGRVEVCYKGNWGTVCDDDFDEKDAAVVCYQLGFPRSGKAWRTFSHHNINPLLYLGAFVYPRVENPFGVGEGQDNIFMDHVECSGQESLLADCNHRGWKMHNCFHSEDVGIRCNPHGKHACTYADYIACSTNSCWYLTTKT